MINLIEETKDYWRKLEELENAYEKGEVSLEEVDTLVTQLMKDLGQKRQEALQGFFSAIATVLRDQPITVLGLSVVGIVK
jgi:hypothetical protein